MNKEILRIAVPSILSNIIVPVLGLVDLTIAGHIGTASLIGAVSVGAMMFSLIYWNFGFLRMGTTGMTAQAFGAGDGKTVMLTLCRAVILALLIGLVIIALQCPLRWLLLVVIAPSDDVTMFAARYFDIIVWGAPASLATMALTGWFVGMKNSVFPLIVSVAVTFSNIVASLSFVFLFGMGFEGIPTGTLIAQWIGFALSVLFALTMMRRHGLAWRADGRQLISGLGRFFKVNSEILMRSICLMAVTLFFTSAGARSGDMVLAVNALFMQLHLFFSYFMDGFAYAAESLVGNFYGAGNVKSMRRCIKLIFRWGWLMAVLFSAVYGCFNGPVVELLADNDGVVRCAATYGGWIAVLPVVSMSAFVWDGVFVGLTATRQMLASLAGATVAFFAVCFLCPSSVGANHCLWLAFTVYLAVRGAILWLIYRRMPFGKQ